MNRDDAMAIRSQLRDWPVSNANGWLNGLISQRCTREPGTRTGFGLWSTQDGAYGEFYSVFTDFIIMANNPMLIRQKNEFKRKLSLDISLYPTQVIRGIERLEGYEVRLFFREPGLLKGNPINELTIVENVCGNLIKNYGFQDKSVEYGSSSFDYAKTFHNLVSYPNIIRDIAPYVGQLDGDGGGQHLEPYIRGIINAL
jgi:hypothetical protein